MKSILIAGARTCLLATPALASGSNYATVTAGVGLQPGVTSERGPETDLGLIVGTHVPFTDVRLELEGDRAFTNGGKLSGVGVTTLGANIAYDLPTVVGFRPYAFGGYGYALLDGNGTVSGTSSPYFALGAGVNRQIDANWSAGLRYRFVDTNVPVIANLPVSRADYRINSLQVTLTRAF